MNQIERFLDYFDETCVEIRFVAMPGTPPEHVWSARFLTTDRRGRDALVREVEAALTESGTTPPHTLVIHRSHVDWGASGAFQDIIVEVAEDVLHEGWDAATETGKLAAGAGLKMLWDKWRTTRRVRADSALLQGLEAAEAEARGRLAHVYGISKDSLTLIKDARTPDDNRWTFEFKDESAAYSVTLDTHGADPITAKISRRKLSE